MLIDGHADERELKALASHPSLQALGLSSAEVDEILQTLCHDLMIGANPDWNTTVRLNATCQRHLLSEITDPVLQASIIQLAEDLVDADGQQHPAESAFMQRMVETWQPIPAWQMAARMSLRQRNAARKNL
jgi:hypothetical protein